MNELRPKLFDVMKGYTKEQLIKDIISGIIVAIIALPLSIALAIASGVGPEQGLYTAIIAGFFISFFGGSRVQIGGPTAAFVVIIYGIVEEYGTDGLIVATILAGIILIIMGICRFGSLIKYIPYTITTGFTCGIAVTLFVGQLKDFFGLEIASVPSEFLNKIAAYIENISTINLTATVIGFVAVIIMLLWPKVTDKIPGYHNRDRVFCETSGQYHWKRLRRIKFCFSKLPRTCPLHETGTADALPGFYDCHSRRYRIPAFRSGIRRYDR